MRRLPNQPINRRHNSPQGRRWSAIRDKGRPIVVPIHYDPWRDPVDSSFGCPNYYCTSASTASFPIFRAHALGVAQGSAAGSSAAAPRLSNSLTNSA